MNRPGNQKGLTLVEVLIALAIFGAIALSVFFALNVSHRTTHTVNRETTAESLSRSALEYIKNSPYDESGSPDYQDEVDANIIPPAGYVIDVTAVPIDPDTYQPLPPLDDDGIQEITVEVYFDGDLVLATENYKVKR